MQGLPASGKSTRAKEIIAQSGNAVRVNKDLLRTMLHFDKFTGVNEGRTRDAARAIVKEMLGKVNVIIDDTNLNPGTLQSWKDLAKECGATPVVEKIETDMWECINRDRIRETMPPFSHVGDSVIVSMALQYGLYPEPENGFVLCDLDGTLADIRHRLHHVRVPEGEKKDWKSFFEAIPQDTPREDVVALLGEYRRKRYDIILLSARPDTYRKETEKWLDTYDIGYVGLLMRRGGDSRPDTEVKAELLERHFKDLSLIHKVIDDRPVVIRMWKEKGLDVIDVGSGVEF